ncbi:restriction endonuclease subunit S [Faecalibacterium prausnitzii]|uniref:restriction endonuclease subunit S n=1 Tax=Faecalibacterium prausnitzii TaxID=853 RepID=UPI001C25229C|nr:restriction endonuclease subunit S [Faecalibacterium prausnitzii]MBU8989836.1 restriction endonuclease subunit S [Faecalibacterium prausnitzii]MCQ5156451.1 restriction endonuclease subunit S [Faecalibacterium prausnitzii]
MPYEKVGKNEPVCIADEVPFDIPESWEWVTLKQIAVTALGKTLDKSKNIGEYRPYLCSINVYWTGIDLSTVKQARFEDSELSKYQLNKGDLLICEGGDVGRSAVWDRDEEMYYQNALHRVRFYGNIEPRFFQLLMESYKGAKILDNYSKGMTIKHLVQNSLNSIYFPLPPLAEQRRIVEKIKQLTPYLKKYGSVETTLSNLNLAFPDDLKKSILQYAVQGKLVPQDPADEPASVLLEHIRAEKEQLIKAGKIKRDKHESVIFRRDNSYYEKVDGIERCIDDELPFEIPESWEWCRLGTILQKLTDGTHSTPKYTARGIPFISVKDISSGKISFERTKFISKTEHELLASRCDPHRDDILLTKVGTTGIPVLVDTDRPFSIFVSVAQLRFSTELLDKFFLIYLLKSPLVQTQCRENTKGVGNKNWVMRDIANTLICIPPLAEQKRIQASLANVLKSI